VGIELLHYSETGNGEPLIILHGLFGSSKNWLSLARVFSRHFRVFAPDLRNHGQSFHHDKMNYSVMVEDVYRLLAHLGIDSCSVIGHSMGGKTAMLLALDHPQLVSRLIVADIAPVTYSHVYQHLIDPIMALKMDQERQLNHLTEFTSLPADWKVSAPTQFIRGEHSDYIGIAEESEIANHFDNATISTVKDAGHWLHAEQPERFSRLVLNFLLR